MPSKVTREGAEVVIRMPLEDVHSLTVALAECPCRATKSTGTKNIRLRLVDALGRAVNRHPERTAS